MIARSGWVHFVVMVGALSLPEVAFGQGTFIPTATRRDHIFDSTGNLLYFTTTDGNLHRYDLLSQSLLAPMPVGVSLNAIDLTPDRTTAFITDRTVSETQGFVRRVDLATGDVTTLTYERDNPEDYSWDVVMMSNTQGFVTTDFGGSGWLPFREIDAATNTLTVRQDKPEHLQRTAMHRSADLSRMVLTHSVLSSGPMSNYDAATDTFTFMGLANITLNSAPGAVSRDGEFFALGVRETRIYDTQGGWSQSLPESVGLVFSPVSDYLYLANPITDQIMVYRTTDWTLESSFPIGENMFWPGRFDDGMMSISDDGSRLALSTPAGIRIYNVPTPGAGGLIAAAALWMSGRRRRS